jgi:hypothetical protein
MGGGSGGKPLSPRELKACEEMAKQKLAAAGSAEKRNVFISFVAEDLADVNLLRAQARNERTDLEFNDWSVKEPFDSEHAEYIKRGIRERIRQCSVTVVYVSEATAGSAWVNWEIAESIRLGKGVVAMYKGTRPPARLPRALTEHAIQPVPWNHDALMAAIAAAAK